MFPPSLRKRNFGIETILLPLNSYGPLVFWRHHILIAKIFVFSAAIKIKWLKFLIKIIMEHLQIPLLFSSEAYL